MQLPTREPQRTILQAALNNPRALPVFLHGPPATAKSATLLDALSSTARNTTHVDCVLSHNDRLLFSAILGRDCAAHPCDLLAALSDRPFAETHAIVFRRAERLSGPNFSASAISALFRLPHLCNQPLVRLVFISRTPWHVFRAALTHHLPTPITVYFPPYAEHHAVSILSDQYHVARLRTHIPSHLIDRAKHFYPGYVKSVVSVLYQLTSDLRELQRVCDDLYPDYITCGKDPGASFNVVQDKLRKSLHTLYSREVVPREKQLSEELAKSRERSHLHTQADLSRSALTLLVAAFLAAQNPPKHDTRYFTTERTNRSRARGRGRGRKTQANSRLSTTRVFSLERLLAIYAAIRVDDDDLVRDARDVSASSSMSTSCLVQISTLVALGYLANDGGGDILSEPKYRSNVSDEQARSISNLLRIELHQYWHKE